MKNFTILLFLLFIACRGEIVSPTYDTSATLTNSKSIPVCKIEIGEFTEGSVTYSMKTIYAFYYKSNFKYLCYFNENGIKTQITEGSKLYDSVLEKCSPSTENLGGILGGEPDTSCFAIHGYKCWD